MLFSVKSLILYGVFLMGDTGALGHTEQHTHSDRDKIAMATKLLSRASYSQHIEKNDNEFLKLTKQACDLGLGRACWYYANETGEAKDLLHAEEILQKDCFAKTPTTSSGESCTFLGIMSSQVETKHNYIEKDLYNRGCNLNNGWGCYRYAADFLAETDSKKAQQYNDKALQILTRECNNNIGSSCYFIGSVYEQPFKIDWLSLEEREKQARFFYQKGCNLGDGDSCYNKQNLWYFLN
ncbi:sel1 repeat family protein [Helicobacter didelphidarum]|uniref:Beta-lactamase n=1 Tax=Helicobacter didelphidarum TaxID=2040648 RepID=A0A3D8IQQ7_9HELI|nr:sel1 repeat family protein [Helicobacter didelphidarum]RDU67618.1 sel1 repeat family protein [Helicobacter didelphidarum]